MITEDIKPDYNKSQSKVGLDRIKLKNYHRLKGRLVSFSKGYKDSYNFVLVKGVGNSKKFYSFETLAPEVIEHIKSLPLKSIVKVIFSIKCKEYNSKWYTTLFALFTEIGVVGEKNVKQTQSEFTLDCEKPNSVLKGTFGDF